MLFEQRRVVAELAGAPGDPFRPAQGLGSNAQLVVELHRLVAQGQSEAGQPTALERGVVTRRKQRLVGIQAHQMLDDQAAVHQTGAVVEDQGRGAHQWIDRVKFGEVAEYRERPVLQRDAQPLRDDVAASHEGGVQHANQLHSISLPGCGPGTSLIAAS